MLDAIEPGQFDEWVAFRSIEPDPDKWLREITKRGLALIAQAVSGAEVDADTLDPWANTEEEEPEVLTGPAAARAVRQKMGLQ